MANLPFLLTWLLTLCQRDVFIEKGSSVLVAIATLLFRLREREKQTRRERKGNFVSSYSRKFFAVYQDITLARVRLKRD